ncbi:MAG: sulfite exporter TauE/SafE family protein [Flavobacteriia bacterium]|nr:sulfite exporter TauE/SafE family protein [Flavobacteriia bacterium]
MNTLLLWAFGIGVIANLHCLGMCGPIAMAIPINRSSKTTQFWGVLQYNFGRITTYSILGFLVGLIGLGIHFIGFLQSLSIVAGFGIIIYAWRKVIFDGTVIQNFSSNFLQKFTSKNMGKILKNNHSFKIFLLGLLNGLLPCGMVYTALITSITAGTPFYSMFCMLTFGLGTLPGMLVITLFANQLSIKFRGRINKVLPYFVTIIGLLILLRGLNLGIPYLSPEIKFSEKTKKVDSITCHKSFNPNKIEK